MSIAGGEGAGESRFRWMIRLAARTSTSPAGRRSAGQIGDLPAISGQGYRIADMSSHVRTLFLSTCLAASLAGAAPAQSASLSPEERKAAVEAITTLVSKHYVFPEKRAGIVEALRSRLASGAYDGLDGPAMAARL